MKSVLEFNQQQRKNFNQLIDDFGGPTMTVFALCTLERIAYELAQPDIDPSWVSEEVKQDAEVCFAAIEYFRMTNLDAEEE